MANGNGRAIDEKLAAKNVLEQMMPGTQPFMPTEKEQHRLDALASRWFAAQQNLDRQRQIFDAATADEKEQKHKMLAVMEYIADEHGVDFAKLNWAFDGTCLLMAVPK